MMTGWCAMGRGGGGEGAACGSAECGDGQRRCKEEFHSFSYFSLSLSLFFYIFPRLGDEMENPFLLFLSLSSLGKRQYKAQVVCSI